MQAKYRNQKHQIIHLPKQNKQLNDTNMRHTTLSLKEYIQFKTQIPQSKHLQIEYNNKNSLKDLPSTKRLSNYNNEQSTSYQSNSQIKKQSPLKHSRYLSHTNNDHDKWNDYGIGIADITQLTMLYNEQLTEKEREIFQLKNELSKCRRQLEKQQLLTSLKPISIYSPVKRMKGFNKINKTFTERLSNYYTPKAISLMRSSNTLTQSRDEAIMLSPKNHLITSMNKTLLSFSSPLKENQKSINVFTKALSPPVQYAEKNNSDNNKSSTLDQIKEKTFNLLNYYYQIARRQTEHIKVNTIK